MADIGTTQELSFGQKAVGLTFNPSNDPLVQEVKEGFAKVIDFCNTQKLAAKTPEAMRMFSIAITEAQTAQMWAVKAVTWKE